MRTASTIFFQPFQVSPIWPFHLIASFLKKKKDFTEALKLKANTLYRLKANTLYRLCILCMPSSAQLVKWIISKNLIQKSFAILCCPSVYLKYLHLTLYKNNLAGGWEHVLTLLNLLACCEVFHTKS